MYKTNDEIREDYGDEIILFEEPSYSTALIGISTDNRAIYDYDLMVQFLMETDKCSEEDAKEYIDFNTINTLGFEGFPVVLYKSVNF